MVGKESEDDRLARKNPIVRRMPYEGMRRREKRRRERKRRRRKRRMDKKGGGRRE